MGYVVVIRALRVKVDGADVSRLANALCQHFNVIGLQRLHLITDYDLFKRENDQSTIWHKLFYEFTTTETFRAWYTSFIRKEVLPVLGDDEGLVYQTIPTFRVQLPGNVAVGEMHTDADYGHGDTEINCWLPLTETFEENTVWIEHHAGVGDDLPEVVELGEMLIFDGVNFMHGNQFNDCDKTRVSIDFRVIPGHRYGDGNSNSSINTHKKFILGEYFTWMQ